jgi:hypothetical protein
VNGRRALRADLAVVPISGVDHQTDEALNYAVTLAPRVLAVCLRNGHNPQADRIADEWSSTVARPPLVIADAPSGDQAGALRRVLDVLKRTEQLDLITVVIPSASPGDGAAWCEGLRGQPGVVVRQTPPGAAGPRI